MSEFTAADPIWLRYAASLGTPSAALIAAAITGVFAWRQSRTARSKLRLDLFEKRYPIYEATLDLLFSWSASVDVPQEDLSKFLREVKGTRWLYSKKFENYLMNDIYRPIERLKRLENSRWMGKTEEERNKISANSDEIQRHLDRQLREIDQNFSPFLQLKH